MGTIQTADNALKSFYLDAVAEALDTKANPFLAKIQRTTSDVVGKDVKKLVKVGLNGGIAAGSETGDLPKASATDYVQLTASLKNIYGTIEISDKAIRAASTNEGAFVNLLNDEMDSLVKSASYHFGRMLFGDGSGRISIIEKVLEDNCFEMRSISGFAEGMIVDAYNVLDEPVPDAQGVEIVKVDRINKIVKLGGRPLDHILLPAGCGLCLHNSFGYEITGLDALFDDDKTTLYGVSKDVSIMQGYHQEEVGDINGSIVQKAIDVLEESTGGKINYILCSWGVKRALVESLKAEGIVLPTVEVNGVKALDFNGVPVVTDRFCPTGTMYLLNTDDFKLHQLCDWQWLEGEDGKILKQIPGKPVYTATLVKYAELLCQRPCGQGKLSGINEI